MYLPLTSLAISGTLCIQPITHLKRYKKYSLLLVTMSTADVEPIQVTHGTNDANNDLENEGEKEELMWWWEYKYDYNNRMFITPSGDIVIPHAEKIRVRFDPAIMSRPLPIRHRELCVRLLRLLDTIPNYELLKEETTQIWRDLRQRVQAIDCSEQLSGRDLMRHLTHSFIPRPDSMNDEDFFGETLFGTLPVEFSANSGEFHDMIYIPDICERLEEILNIFESELETNPEATDLNLVIQIIKLLQNKNSGNFLQRTQCYLQDNGVQYYYYSCWTTLILSAFFVLATHYACTPI